MLLVEEVLLSGIAYHIDRVIGHKISGPTSSPKVKFEVKWVGYYDCETDWIWYNPNDEIEPWARSGRDILWHYNKELIEAVENRLLDLLLLSNPPLLKQDLGPSTKH